MRFHKSPHQVSVWTSADELSVAGFRDAVGYVPGSGGAHLDGLLHVARVPPVLERLRARHHDVHDHTRAPQIRTSTL